MSTPAHTIHPLKIPIPAPYPHSLPNPSYASFLPAPCTSFLTEFYRWSKCTAHDSSAYPTFVSELAAFLAVSDYTCLNTTYYPNNFDGDVVWSSDKSSVKAARMQIAMVAPSDVTGRIKNMNEMRREFEFIGGDKKQRRGVKGYVWSYFFLYSDRDSVLWKLVEQVRL